ncbi:MAG: UDP-N-acetylmuramate--L-alanine ligase [Rickettsiales bacterium]
MINALPLSHTMSLNVGVIHFVGIGGIGMSGIAEVLHNLGYKVQGSDAAESYNTQRLKNCGIDIAIGHDNAQVEKASVVVISSAIKSDNPELVKARELRLPVVKRAEMLAELMRLKMSIAIAGTHGKTTTTALMAAMLEAGKLQPTVINGGIINARGTNAYLGEGEWMVVEADESDGSFTKLPATIGIITNIDPEHLDHYGSFEQAKAAFNTFVTNIPFYGFAVLCADHPETQALASRIRDRRVITYGVNPQADVRARNVQSSAEGECFDVEINTRDNPRTIKGIKLPMHGAHNMSNALAAIAVATELEIADDIIISAFDNFEGVKRRFTITGEGNGLRVVDDYAHHPVEIIATLKAARAAQKQSGGKVIAVVQPHRYTRVRDLFDEFCTCFNDADTVIITEIYSAGEDPIDKISADTLAEGLRAAGHKNVMTLESQEKLAETVREAGRAGDMVVCMGAGSITKWAQTLPDELAKLMPRKKAAS